MKWSQRSIQWRSNRLYGAFLLAFALSFVAIRSGRTAGIVWSVLLATMCLLPVPCPRCRCKVVLLSKWMTCPRCLLPTDQPWPMGSNGKIER